MSDSMPASDPGDAIAEDVRVGDVLAADDDLGPSPLGVDRSPTGHPGVDALVERLGDVDHLGTDGHLGVYEDVHRGLRSALTALDARQGPPGPGTSGPGTSGPGTSGPGRPLADQRP
ncbi:hypothetical protein [Streptomyces sp. NPDC048361]|uniref:hypothetical protein n=1 Tax=Streptomyces sp. NPDC048361 TaxID=3154720 RepID=UPI00343B5790